MFGTLMFWIFVPPEDVETRTLHAITSAQGRTEGGKVVLLEDFITPLVLSNMLSTRLRYNPEPFFSPSHAATPGTCLLTTSSHCFVSTFACDVGHVSVE